VLHADVLAHIRAKQVLVGFIAAADVEQPAACPRRDARERLDDVGELEIDPVGRRARRAPDGRLPQPGSQEIAHGDRTSMDAANCTSVDPPMCRRPLVPPSGLDGLPVADPLEERVARAVMLIATAWFTLAASWELFGPILAGHYAASAGAGVMADNMLRWRIL